MDYIKVIDARMGRGKSSAAIRYMNENKGKKRFLYITPYLDEVDRICEYCDFDQPESDKHSKSAELKRHLIHGDNVAASHSLFYLMDKEALDLVVSKHYSLIIDESINAVSKVYITDHDFKIVTEQMTTEDEFGMLHWIDDTYDGAFSVYKEMADAGSLYRLNSALLNLIDPNLIKAFDEVYMLTYLFEGQYQKAYLEYFGFDYKVCGVEVDEEGFKFSDKPDAPPPVDYRDLIHIVDSEKMNSVGDKPFSLSKAWYNRRGYHHSDIVALRSRMDTFFRKMTSGGSNKRLWSCFKESHEKLIPKNGRYRDNFLQISSRATNQYKNRTDIAYLANRFADPNVLNFFAQRDIQIDADKFALSEMLQWIWRSAIRDGEPINAYIPSKRMRMLLIDWINETSNGGKNIEE